MCQTALTGRRNSVSVASGEERPVLTWRDLKHRTLKPASGAHRPVRCQNISFSAHESGGHRTRSVPHKKRPVTPRWAHKARAQGVSWLVFLFLSRSRPSRALLLRALAPPPSVRRSPATSAVSPRTDPLPSVLSSLSTSRNFFFAKWLGFG